MSSGLVSNITKIEIIKIAPRNIIDAYTSNKETSGVETILPKSPPALFVDGIFIIPRPESKNVTELTVRIHPMFGLSTFTKDQPSSRKSTGIKTYP